jgi:hypothetical protein
LISFLASANASLVQRVRVRVRMRMRMRVRMRVSRDGARGSRLGHVAGAGRPANKRAIAGYKSRLQFGIGVRGRTGNRFIYQGRQVRERANCKDVRLPCTAPAPQPYSALRPAAPPVAAQGSRKIGARAHWQCWSSWLAGVRVPANGAPAGPRHRNALLHTRPPSRYVAAPAPLMPGHGARAPPSPSHGRLTSQARTHNNRRRF